MMNVTRARLRGRNLDLSEVPWGVWVVLALAVLYVFNISQTGFGLEPSRVPSAILNAGPFFFAAAVLYAVPKDRRLVWGAILVVVPLTIRLLQEMIPPIARADIVTTDVTLVSSSIGRIAETAGYVLLGLGLGGVATRRTWLIVGAILALAVASYVGNLVSLVNNEVFRESGLLTQTAITSIGILAIAANAYFFATALDHRLRFTALGAGIYLVAWVVSFGVQGLQLGPDTNFSLINAAFSVAGLVGWLALIWGALTEFPIASRQTSKASA